MPPDSVSIAICTKDRADHLENTLDALADVQNPNHLTVELIVVENNSADHTAQVVHSQDVPFSEKRLIPEPRVGVAHARNTALENATGDIILFTDDDIRFPENWIAGMTTPIVDGDADAVAGGVRIAPHLERSWMEPWHRSFLASSHRIEDDPVTDMVGANMAVARYVLDEIPTFDPRLGAGQLGFSEESLFALRLHRAGFRIAPAFDVEVEHHFSPSRLSRDAFLSAAKKLGRSMAYIHKHHLPKRSVFPDSRLHAYTHLLKLRIKLFLKRQWLRPHQRDTGPPVPGWENYYVRQIAYLEQSLRERP
jgi:glycosyltransferase involved in cell wall biosynthesis